METWNDDLLGHFMESAFEAPPVPSLRGRSIMQERFEHSFYWSQGLNRGL